MNKINLNKWYDHIHEVESNIVTSNQISLALDSLKLKLIRNGIFDNNKVKLLILFKIKTVNMQNRTISYMQTLSLEDFTDLYQLFIEFWNLKTEDYYLAAVSEIIFSYKLVDENLETKLIKAGHKVKPEKVDTFKFGGYNLPATMDITKWGNCHFLDDNNAIVYKVNSLLEYHVSLFDKHQTVTLILNGKTLLTFMDTMNNKSDLTCFIRKLKNQEYLFENGVIMIKKIERQVSFLQKSKRDMFNSKNFITMDLETRVINGLMSSYCVSIYDGKEFKSFYLLDYSSEKDMLKASIIYLMKRKYHNYKVYLHNFSRFDSVFLLTVLSDLSDNIKPIIRDGNIINLKFKFAKKYNLYFRDSLLILPGTLRSLAENFKVESKGIFPYKFVNNENISLDYIGAVPSIEYFDKLTYEEYHLYSTNKEFMNNNWNLREQTIKYCELDCFVLYQIISVFSDTIFKLFRVDILKNSTLSSLAFNIFRTKFLKDSKIPLIHGEIYNFIKRSYTGGAVDVYIPKPPKGVKVKRYDVNSLYPNAMKSYPMPIGKPTYFEGDILKSYGESYKPYGIFEVDVVAPSNIRYPLLQTRIKTESGYRTISPIGNWSGVYFSDELYNAAKYGYTFTIKRGYIFNSGDIFGEYVDFLYNIKMNSNKATPYYTISKLLLNSL